MSSNTKVNQVSIEWFETSLFCKPKNKQDELEGKKEESRKQLIDQVSPLRRTLTTSTEASSLALRWPSLMTYSIPAQRWD